MKRPVSTQISFKWLQNRNQQQAEVNRRIYSPANRQLFTYAWYVLDEILNVENVLTRFNQLIELWALSGCQLVANDYMEYLDKHQEWKTKSLATDVLKYNHTPMVTSAFQSQHENNMDFDQWTNTLIDFVLRTFNTGQNYANHTYKVSPDRQEAAPLLTAITLRSLMSFHGFNIHNLEKYQYANVDAAMTSDRDTREKRKLTRIFNRFKMVHSETLREHAYMWIGCRVNPGTIEAYLNQLANVFEQVAPTILHLPAEEQDKIKKKYFPDGGLVSRTIRPYDDAVGLPI